MPCVLCTIFAHGSFTLCVYNASQSLGMMEYVGAGLYIAGGGFRGVFTPTLLLASETSPSHIHHKKAYKRMYKWYTSLAAICMSTITVQTNLVTAVFVTVLKTAG